MDMANIMDELMQDIERSAFPLFYAKSEYRQNQRCALEHYQWLEEHLDDEQKTHFQKAWDAELRLDILEREAMVRTALAMGIRLTLPQ